MADLDIGQTTTIDNTAQDFTVASETTDTAMGEKENTWEFPDFNEDLGYYEEIPEYRQSIKALANWTVGRGYETDSRTKVILDHVTGWGEDTFDSIMWNMMVTKKFVGDAMAQIIKDEKTGLLVNLKPLPMDVMKTVANAQGRVVRYEQVAKNERNKVVKKFKPNQVLHLVNDRHVDSIHGTSVSKSVRWVMDARNEAMRDKRRVLHLSTIRVIEVDTEDTSKRNTLATQYAAAIKNGTVMLVPKGGVGFPDVPPMVHASDDWIRYLEDFFYQAVGVPKVILGGSSDFTEASSKVAYVSFEQVWGKEQRELEMDLWNQMQLKIEFNKPVSFVDNSIQQQEASNQEQTGFQPNDTTIGGVTNETANR